MVSSALRENLLHIQMSEYYLAIILGNSGGRLFYGLFLIYLDLVEVTGIVTMYYKTQISLSQKVICGPATSPECVIKSKTLGTIPDRRIRISKNEDWETHVLGDYLKLMP